MNAVFGGSHVSVPIGFMKDFPQHQQDSSCDYIHVKICDCFSSFMSPIRILEVRCLAGDVFPY